MSLLRRGAGSGAPQPCVEICFWHSLDQSFIRSKLDTLSTYLSTGSSAGLTYWDAPRAAEASSPPDLPQVGHPYHPSAWQAAPVRHSICSPNDSGDAFTLLMLSAPWGLGLCVSLGPSIRWPSATSNTLSTDVPEWLTDDGVLVWNACLFPPGGLAFSWVIIKKHQSLMKSSQNLFKKIYLYHENTCLSEPGDKILKEELCSLLNWYWTHEWLN